MTEASQSSSQPSLEAEDPSFAESADADLSSSSPRISGGSAPLMELMLSWTWDPQKFCRDVFIQQPREFQPELLEAVRDNPRTAVKACRDAGKSVAGAYAFWWWLCTRPKSLIITTAPTGRQVKGGLWAEIRNLWNNSKLPKLFPKWDVQQGAVATGDPIWRAMGFSSDDPEKFEFGHAPRVLLIYDEAKLIGDGVYDSLQGLLTDDTDWRELAISTPAGREGWFFDAFTKHRHFWKTISISGEDLPRLKNWVRGRAEAWGVDSPNYRRQVLAQFAGAEKGALIPLHFVEQCIDLGLPYNGRWLRIVAVDPAGQGSDETVITYRWGPIVMRQDAWSHRDEMETVGAVVKLVKAFQPDIIAVDKPGLGGPIISRLKEVLDPTGMRRLVRAFNPQERAGDEETYENLKCEVAYEVRRRFRDKQISIPDDGELIAQLTSYTVKDSSRGRNRLVDPQKSPDRADSLLIAFWPDLVRVGAATANIAGL